MNNIQNLSRILKYLLSMVLLSIVVCYIGGWFFTRTPDTLISLLHASFAVIPELAIEQNLDFKIRVLGFCADLPCVILALCVTYYLIQLFRKYERGEYFSTTTVNYFKRIGWCLLIRELLRPISQILISGILTMNNAPGHRVLKIGLGSDEINSVIIALFIILISWIMLEGQRLNEEQQLTV